MVMKMKNQPFYVFAKFVVKHRNAISKLFILITLLSAIVFPFVGVNYDLSKYLPEFAQTKQALDIMEDEFGYPGMARVMVKNISKYEAKQIRDEIADVEGVDMVIGDDLLENIYAGTGFMQTDFTDDFYKDGNAVMQIVFKGGDSDKQTRTALKEIYKIVGYDRGFFSGSTVSNQFREENITKEIIIAIILALIIIFAILAFATTSWFEPVLFILIMVIAIILNMGTNIIFGSISFFTFSTAAVLQLAVSMDYSIFLLHTFEEYEAEGIEIEEAMTLAVSKSCNSILASGATTIVGFLTMAIMRYNIGRDIGFVLTKGIICSLLAVLLLMPSLIINNDARIKKYKHKSYMPSFDGLGKIVGKIKWPVLICCLLLAVPSYIGEGMNKFYYGDDAIGASPGTKYYNDTREINAIFGKSNMVIAMVPNNSRVQEKAVTDAINDLDFVNYAISLAGVLPDGIPESFVPDKVVDQLHTDKYARIIISMNNAEESDYAFECSKKLDDTVREYYPEDSYVIGMTATTMDIRDILTDDYNKVSVVSLIGVIIVVALTFKSILIPLFVVLPIQIAIYFNMTLPYLAGESLIYMCYIIVSCLQLGATIDYSILLTNNYFDERKKYSKDVASERAISKSASSIFTSGFILVVVGYLLHFISSMNIITEVGQLVGRGALLSMLLVLSLLPSLLSAVDGIIMRKRPKHSHKKIKGADTNED